jgi:hypothetical protein
VEAGNAIAMCMAEQKFTTHPFSRVQSINYFILLSGYGFFNEIGY